MAGSKQPDPPKDGDPPADPPDKEPDRLDKIEAEQAQQRSTLEEHGGMLTKILDRLPGKSPDPTDGPTPSPTGPSEPPADIQSAVRKEIADAKARQAEEDKAKADTEWRAAVDEVIEKVKSETPPREPQVGLKGKLQRAMFGADR